MKTASADYNRKAKGENKGEILSEFITTMNPVILDIQKKKVEPEDNHMKDFEKQEYERKMQLMQEKIKSLESQLQTKKETAVSTSQAQGGRRTTKPTGQGGPPKDPKNNKKGCCGKGSCSLM